MVTESQWWQSAVFYQIYPRSFSDSNGDGIGDLSGITARLGYLELLEIDAIWLGPITQSPMIHHGYDVSDPRTIDPIFGTMADFEELIDQAHARDIKIILDISPNHTSVEHPWFQAALASPPYSLERKRYYFRDGKGKNGEEPPNDWPSLLGGSAWTRVHDAHGQPEQWYLHLFSSQEPDLNWNNPEIWEDLECTLNFWLDKGVDGFCINSAHGLAKPENLPDGHFDNSAPYSKFDTDIRFNNPEVHNIHRKIRSVINKYPGTIVGGEICVDDEETFSQYIRTDELHLAFNFKFTQVPFETTMIRSAIECSLHAVKNVHGTPTWSLSHHDISREVTRYADSHNLEIGLQRARAMILLIMALPGSVFIYQGSELGLPDALVPEEYQQDMVGDRSNDIVEERKSARIPLPWEGETNPFGFTTHFKSWLPLPDEWSLLTVEKQLEDPLSTFSLYRATIEIKKNQPENNSLNIQWFEAPENCLAFTCENSDIICALNGTEKPIDLPPGQVILASAPLVGESMAPYSAVWVKCPE